MNKKMRELMTAIETKRKAAAELLCKSTGSETLGAEVTAAIKDLDDTVAQYELAERIFTAEKLTVPDEGNITGAEQEKTDGFTAISKILCGAHLSDTEKALITGGTNGEDNIIPQDIRTAITELRRSYKSAKELVTIVPVSVLTGSYTYESGVPAGLSAFTDGGEVAAATEPTFISKKFTVNFYGKMIPISNILKNAEKGGLMSYLNTWFVKNAILTENEAIFSALKTGKTVKTLKGGRALKESLNKDLDPDVLGNAIIVTNQTGFAMLDDETDGNNRPILTPDPTQPSIMRFKGLPVHVFADRLLPNVGVKAPMFYGSVKDGCQFMDYNRLTFAISEHWFFNKNQTCLRVMEGFDVMGTDKETYIYATFEPTPAASAPSTPGV